MFFLIGGVPFWRGFITFGCTPLNNHNRGLLIRGWHYPTVLAHAILFDSSFVSQTFRETPKPPDLLTVKFFPSLELTPDPRSYRENAEGFVASDAGRFPHPKSAQRISNAPSGSPRFLEGTENPLLQKYISYTKPMEKGTETLREFTGLLFLTFTETWGDFSIRRVTSCYIILSYFIGITCFWNSPQVQ